MNLNSTNYNYTFTITHFNISIHSKIIYTEFNLLKLLIQFTCKTGFLASAINHVHFFNFIYAEK